MKQVIIRQNIEDEERCIEYELISGKGVRYRLLKDCFYKTNIQLWEDISLGFIRMYRGGSLHILAGYESNGANVIPDTDEVIRAAFIHDALCELLNHGDLKEFHVKHINDIFRDICIADGMDKWKYQTYRFFLRLYWRGGKRL